MSPSSSLVDITPNEVWYGKNPSLTHLKVFGCDAFVHVPKEKRRNMYKRQSNVFSLGIKKG
jgi:hypothetical protein